MNSKIKLTVATCVGFSLGLVFCFHMFTTYPDRFSSPSRLCVGITAPAENSVKIRPGTEFAENLVVQRGFPRPRDSLDLRNADGASQYEAGIPHIFHQTWSGYMIPQSIVPYVKSWSKYHPDWAYWYWRDEDIALLVQKLFPWFLTTFHSYSNHIMRTDVFRYLVLHEFGGFYADMDMELLRKLDPLLEGRSCILSQEPLEHTYFIFGLKRLASNAVMASTPGHPFFGQLIKELPIIFKHSPAKDVQQKTGPKMLEKFLQVYTASLERDGVLNRSAFAKVYVATPDEMMPHFDNGQRSTISASCSRSRQNSDWTKLCNDLRKRNFQNKGNGDSFTTHHWIHFFASWFSRKYVGVDVRDLVPVVNVTERILARMKTKFPSS